MKYVKNILLKIGVVKMLENEYRSVTNYQTDELIKKLCYYNCVTYLLI